MTTVPYYVCYSLMLAIIYRVCDAVTFVNISDSATISLHMPSSDTVILSPNSDIIAQKTGDNCSLQTNSQKYQLLSTQCSTNLNIKITGVTADDAGDYKCSSSQCSQKLVVLGQPKQPNITASTDNLFASKDISLLCETKSTSLPPDHGVGMTYSWFVNENLIAENERSILLKSVPISYFNNAYTCIAREVNGPPSESSAKYILKPEFREVLTMTVNGSISSNQGAIIGDMVHIECTGTAYPNFTSISLRRNNYQFLGVKNTNYLDTWLPVECYDNAEFRCHGYHKRGNIYSGIISLQIPCQPRFPLETEVPLVLHKVRARSMHIDIRIIDNPTPTYSIKRITPTGLKPFAKYNEIQPRKLYCRLYFRNWVEDAYGHYQLTANNSEGIFTTNITIIGPPPPPRKLVAWSTTPNTVHLTWLAGENIWSIPKYQVMYKKEGAAWTESSNHQDSGSKITIVISSLQQDTQYYFLVSGNRYGDYGFYSNMAEVKTIKNGDLPQTQPQFDDIIESITHSPTTYSDTEATTLFVTTEGVRSMKPESLRFEAGVGIGLAVGIVIAVIAVIISVVCLRKSDIKQRPETTHDRPVIDPDVNTITIRENSMYHQDIDTISMQPTYTELISSSIDGGYINPAQQVD